MAVALREDQCGAAVEHDFEALRRFHLHARLLDVCERVEIRAFEFRGGRRARLARARERAERQRAVLQNVGPRVAVAAREAAHAALAGGGREVERERFVAGARVRRGVRHVARAAVGVFP